MNIKVITIVFIMQSELVNRNTKSKLDPLNQLSFALESFEEYKVVFVQTQIIKI